MKVGALQSQPSCKGMVGVVLQMAICVTSDHASSNSKPRQHLEICKHHGTSCEPLVAHKVRHRKALQDIGQATV